ncbi:unnamed protein product [Cylicocyclus nassatus]|uniref:4-coumarate--CoA ligase n=1 Tax=Cylicocyclus nassatus TaxID=53992 RepID=A0AA36ME59_CYLNA|nr:unnamed protein product [Cylicocyclus nassatus]
MTLLPTCLQLHTHFCELLFIMGWQRLRSSLAAGLSKLHHSYYSTSSGVIKSDYPPVPLPRLSFPASVLAAVNEHSLENRTAFICPEINKEVKFKTISDSAFAFATFLSKSGFHEKDVASAVLANRPEFPSMFLGVTLNGGLMTSTSPLSTEYELQRHFTDSQAKLVITNRQALTNVLKAVQQCGSIKTIICIDDQSSTSLPPGIQSWNHVLETAPDYNLKLPTVDFERDAVYMPYSSGTAGDPKGVLLTHKNYIAMTNIFRGYDNFFLTGALDPPYDKENEKQILIIPFYHCYGFCMMMISILNGCTAVLLSHFKPDTFCSAIQNHRVRWIAIAPPILSFLARSPICANYDLSSLEGVFSGSAPAPKHICEELLQKYEHIKCVQQGYGLSETCMVSHLPDVLNGQPPGSVGKVLPNLEAKIVDPDTGDIKAHGEMGEICVRGPTVMLGYHRKPEMTQQCIRDGWMHTGDVGYVDEKGYLYIVDRLKELIKVKGFQVPPAELEQILSEHPAISEAVVVGIPHDRKGEVPKAYVVRQSPSLSEEEVKVYVAERVSSHKHLVGGVEFVEKIPKTPSGKPMRRVLRDRNRNS